MANHLANYGGTLVPILSITTILFHGFSLGSSGSDEISKGLQSITAREIKAHINFLASAMLEGRGNGERGLELAAGYIAAQFEDAGLEPIGDDSSYFQAFDLIHRTLGEPNLLELTVRQGASRITTDYDIGEDFIPFPFTVSKKVVAPVVFVGYGITAPEYEYDDYKAIDVTGKVVLMLRHEPQERDSTSVFKGATFTEHAQFIEKVRNAQKHGAIGMLLVTDPLNHNTYGVQSVDIAWPQDAPARRMVLLLPDPENNPNIPAIHINMEVAEEFFGGTRRNLRSVQMTIDNRLKPSSFALKNKTVLLQTKVHDKIVTVRNVVGMVKGSTDEAVVIGAHYDHEGLDGEQIFYGADDDASGTVGLLEISEAFMLNENKPERSVVFLAFAAEEKGLLGSKYYVEHPLVPLDKTIAMLHADMIGRNEDTESIPPNRRGGFPVVKPTETENKVYVIGTSYSEDMKKISERNNQGTGLLLHYDYDNVQNSIRRSDHWSFIEKGIPSIFYFTGLHPDYHTPGDTPDKIIVEKMERVLKLVYMTAWDLANTKDKPTQRAPEETD